MIMDIKGYIKSKTIPIMGNLKTYKPLYNYFEPLGADIPMVYNKEGRLYDFYFMRDIHNAHAPYRDTGKYFIWDRYNWGLKTHFYTHKAMLQTMGQPNRRFGMLVESRSIVPMDYKIFKRHRGLEKEFERIFTFDDEILNDISNACFYPAGAEVRFGKGKEYLYASMAYEKKTKNVSFLSSDKIMCEMHKKRIAAARFCHLNHLADVYGQVIRGGFVEIEKPLEAYRFSFAIENNQTDYYFSEKITNCFAAQTVPIYLGAKKIGDFFNEDGIIFITEQDLDHIENVLKQCTKEEYERRQAAIKDNYKRVQKYRNMQDYLYETYLMDGNTEGTIL